MSSEAELAQRAGGGEVMGQDDQPDPGIQQRTFRFALKPIKLFQHLEKGKGGAGRVIARQFLRSATSVEASIEEAQSAESRADFIHKLTVSQKEARESLYWLRLLEESEILSKGELDSLLQESQAIIAIITSIIVNTKKNRRPRGGRSDS